VTSKQLQAKIEKLKTKIDTRQSELAELRQQQKELRAKLAEAKTSEKTRKPVGSRSR
jgi:hypothetical protein